MSLGAARPSDIHRPQASVWPLVATWATDINTDPGCGRTIAPDSSCTSHPPNTNLTPSGGPDHRPLHGPQRQQEPDINSAASGPRTTISPTGAAITSDSGGSKAFHTGLFLTTLPSSDLALSSPWTSPPYSLSLPHTVFARHNGVLVFLPAVWHGLDPLLLRPSP